MTTVSIAKGAAVMMKVAMVKVVAVGAALVCVVALGVGVGMLLAGGGNAPVAGSGAAAAASPWPTGAAATRPMLEVTSVVEAHSDKLLKEVLAGIEENRKKLKTLEVEGVAASEQWDPEKKEWTEGGRTEGKGWIETAAPQRARLEISWQKSPWTNGAAPFVEESFTEVWDGQKTRRLFGPPYSGERGQIRDDGFLDGKGVLGEGFSLQLMAMQFVRDGKMQKEYLLDPAMLARMRLTARRVVLNGKQAAVELEVGFPEAAKDPRGRANKHTSKFWFDPKRGYGLLGHWETPDGMVPYWEYAVDEMVEAAPGVFYPSKGRMMWTDHGTPFQRTTFTASKVTANKALAADAFELQFAEGVSVEEQGGGTSQPATQR